MDYLISTFNHFYQLYIVLFLSIFIAFWLNWKKKNFYGLYYRICLTVMTYCVVQFDSFNVIERALPFMLIVFAVQLMVIALGVPLLVIALLYHVIRLFSIFPKYGWKIILIILSYLVSAVLFYLVMASMSEEFLRHRSMMIGLMFLSLALSYLPAGFMLPVIALAISVLIERRLDKRKQPFFGLFFPIMLCLTIYEHGLIKFHDTEISLKVGFVLLFFCYPLVLIALLYSGIRLYFVYKYRVWKAISIVSYYLVASWIAFCTPSEHFMTILIGFFLPSLYLYLDKDQQFQVSHSPEGVKDEN